MTRRKLRILTALAVFFGICAYFYFDLDRYATIEALKEQDEHLRAFYAAHPAELIAGFLLLYTASVTLSLPIATILTLAGGAIFGFWLGLILVSIASTVGATFAFLLSRFLLRDWVQKRFADKLAILTKGIERDGEFYLFSLRLVPIFPFFLINLVMGLTPVKSIPFFFVSQVGMLPGTVVYVNAGTQLAKVQSLNGILSWQLLLSFAALGVLPIAAKKVLEKLRSLRTRDGK